MRRRHELSALIMRSPCPLLCAACIWPLLIAAPGALASAAEALGLGDDREQAIRLMCDLRGFV